MNKITLFWGSGIMVILGLIFNVESVVAVGIGLMWIGLSIKEAK